jgi:hypothetical protein
MAIAAGTNGHRTFTIIDAVQILLKVTLRKWTGWMPVRPLSPALSTRKRPSTYRDGWCLCWWFVGRMELEVALVTFSWDMDWSPSPAEVTPVADLMEAIPLCLEAGGPGIRSREISEVAHAESKLGRG